MVFGATTTKVDYMLHGRLLRHVNLLILGKLTEKNGQTLQLMNTMGNLVQFVVSIIVDGVDSVIWAKSIYGASCTYSWYGHRYCHWRRY